MTTIKESWDSYYKSIVPKDAGLFQIIETRRAFYAGASAFLGAVMGMLGPGEEPTESDLKVMDDLAQELKDFHSDVARGAA